MNPVFFDHNIWILVFAGIAWLVKLLSKKPAPPSKPAPDDAAEARTRRVQAEVQRKIAERRAGRAPVPPPVRYEGPLASPTVAPRPIARPQPSWIESNRTDTTIAPEPVPPTVEETAALVRQQQLAEQIRNLAAASLEVAAPARALAAGPAAAGPAPAESWLAELRRPQGVRRAILAREILGPPVCFR